MRNKSGIIANISGFYGDQMSAAKEMFDGGRVDCNKTDKSSYGKEYCSE